MGIWELHSKSFTFVFDSDHNLIGLVDKIGGGRKDSRGLSFLEVIL